MIAANTKNCSGSIAENINGLLVEPRNSKDLASKIISLIKNPELREKLGRKARESVIRNFDEKFIIKKVINFLYS